MMCEECGEMPDECTCETPHIPVDMEDELDSLDGADMFFLDNIINFEPYYFEQYGDDD